MSGFVVVLRDKVPGVEGPSSTVAGYNIRGVAYAASRLLGSVPVDPPRYLCRGDGVLELSEHRQRAKVFASKAGAQAAIDRIPKQVRPRLSIEPVGG